MQPPCCLTHLGVTGKVNSPGELAKSPAAPMPCFIEQAPGCCDSQQQEFRFPCYPLCVLCASKPRPISGQRHQVGHLIPVVHAGKPPAKGKAAAKPAPKKQNHSRKRKLDEIHLQAAAAQTQHRLVSQPALTPLLAAPHVPVASSPTVHAAVTCNPDSVQAALPVTSVTTTAPAVVTQRPLLAPKLAGTLAAGEEAAAAASSSDIGEVLWVPDQPVQPDLVMTDVLPTTAATSSEAAEDSPQLSPQAILQAQDPMVGSLNCTAAASAAEGVEPQWDAPHPVTQAEPHTSWPCVEPLAVRSDGTGLSACGTPPQGSTAAEAASITHQAVPDASASLSNTAAELALSVLEPAPATGCLDEPLPVQHGWSSPTAAGLAISPASAENQDALEAAPSEAQHNLGRPETTGQLLCHHEPAKADVLCEPVALAEVLLACPRQGPSLSTAPGAVVTGAGAVKGSNIDSVLTVTPQDTRGIEACIPDGTVVMLKGDNLLGLANYTDSDSDGTVDE